MQTAQKDCKIDYIQEEEASDMPQNQSDNSNKMRSFERLMAMREEFLSDLDDDFDPAREYEEAIEEKYGPLIDASIF